MSLVPEWLCTVNAPLQKTKTNSVIYRRLEMLKPSIEKPFAVIPFSSMKSENKFTGVFIIVLNKYLSIQNHCRVFNVGSEFMSDLRRSQKSQFLYSVAHFARYMIDSVVAGISELNCTAHVDTVKFLHFNFFYRSIKDWLFVLYKISWLSSLS